ncbi:MAG: sterol desaturase family protein [Halioglobus sp.]
MDAFLSEYFNKTTEVFTVLFFAYMSLLCSWPVFLLLEKISPVNPKTPRSNYALNWQVTASNLLLAPGFTAGVILFTAYISSAIGLPGLEIPVASFSVGILALDVILQGLVIFLTACFLGDFWYYWWHRMQHKIPFLWEMHKVHHSDETLNSTTIYRSHFLESAGQALIRGLSIGLIFDITKAPESLLAALAGGLLIVLWDYFVHANVRIDRLHRLLPFFSTPQYHWIHHSKMPEHQDKNFSIWLPVFDIAFGSYYHPRVDEYPPTGLSSGEKIETLWRAQTAPLVAWAGTINKLLMRKSETRQTES